jgi:ABC-type multidrug transport system fused ATPase/permease subunit
MEAVRALHGQKTVLIIAHRLTTVAHCDTVHRFEQGRLVASGPLDQLGS